jgi:hypothetical protein
MAFQLFNCNVFCWGHEYITLTNQTINNEYITPFNLSYFKKVNDHTICIPDFHLHGPLLFNDRFCITNAKTYLHYGDTFPYLLEISKKEPLHSETVLGNMMAGYGIRFAYIPFHFIRVRYHGVKEDRDVKEFSKIDPRRT